MSIQSAPTSFNILVILHLMPAFNDGVKVMELKVTQSYANETLIGWWAYLMAKAWRLLLERARMSVQHCKDTRTVYAVR